MEQQGPPIYLSNDVKNLISNYVHHMAIDEFPSQKRVINRIIEQIEQDINLMKNTPNKFCVHKKSIRISHSFDSYNNNMLSAKLGNAFVTGKLRIKIGNRSKTIDEFFPIIPDYQCIIIEFYINEIVNDSMSHDVVKSIRVNNKRTTRCSIHEMFTEPKNVKILEELKPYYEPIGKEMPDALHYFNLKVEEYRSEWINTMMESLSKEIAEIKNSRKTEFFEKILMMKVTDPELFNKISEIVRKKISLL